MNAGLKFTTKIEGETISARPLLAGNAFDLIMGLKIIYSEVFPGRRFEFLIHPADEITIIKCAHDPGGIYLYQCNPENGASTIIGESFEISKSVTRGTVEARPKER